MATEADTETLHQVERKVSQEHYGELVAMDRSIGTLRKRSARSGDRSRTRFSGTPVTTAACRALQPSTTGGLRDFKGSMYEGGLRVPAIIEWPVGITKPRITRISRRER